MLDQKVYFWSVPDRPSWASLLLCMWSHVKDDKDLDMYTRKTFLLLISPLTTVQLKEFSTTSSMLPVTVEKGERKKEQMKTEFLCGTMFVLLDHNDGDWLLHLVKQQKRLRNDWLCNSDYLNQDVLASEATMQRARRSWLCCSGSRVFPASPSVVHPLLISENTKTIEQMEEEHCPCIWLNALKGHF